MSASKTTIVIVNWNGGAYLEELIRSIQAEDPAQTIVVDNNSTDTSLNILEKHPNISLIANQRNLGFGAAANQGFALAKTPNVLILNVDLRSLPGSISAMEKFLDDHEDAAVVAPGLLFPDGSLQLSCRKFPTLGSLFLHLSFLDRIVSGEYRLSAREHIDTREVEQPMGAALMVRKKVLDEIGSFDESYFLYMEDVDLCERIVRAGWKIYYFPGAKFVHDAGGSSRQDWFNSQKHFLDSAQLYFRKKQHGMARVKSTLAVAYLIRSVVYLLSAKFKNAASSFRLSGHALKFE